MPSLTISSIAVTATPTQLFTRATPQLMALRLIARSDNTGAVYVEDDSSAGATEALKLNAGESENWDFSPVTIDANSIYVWGSGGSSDQLDFVAVKER